MSNNNLTMIETIAKAFGDMCDRIVFVGGATTVCYVNRSGAPESRPTLDVDCIIDVTSRQNYSHLETVLRAKGFMHDTSEGAPVCRWIYAGIKVDIMPTDERILGFNTDRCRYKPRE